MKKRSAGSAARRADRRRKRPRRAKARPLAWTTLVERRSLSWIVNDVDAAKATFKRLPPPEKVALLREIADTRGPELVRAYPNLVAVAYGFRRTASVAGRPEDARELCLKFMVKRKWRRDIPGHRHRLPSHLFAYCTVDGERRPCAVPTDVEDAREHSGAQLHAPRFVVATSESPPARLRGVLTCSITRSTDGAAVYAVSCQHLLSPARDLTAAFAPADVTLFDGGATVLATSVPVRGTLGDIARYSLDCQLARMTDRLPEARAALGGLDVAGHATHQDSALLAAEIYIVTPRGAIAAEVNAMRGEEHAIPYGGTSGNVRHERLVEVRTQSPTRGGDSGSPVFTREDGGMLLGMLIAGPPDEVPDEPGTLSYFIPASHVLDPGRYIGGIGESWKLATP